MNTNAYTDNYLINYITRNDYFQRSININADNNDIAAINNFYCTASYEQLLISMIKNIEAGQTAFTWTGPFGSGKSSLALFLQSLISDNQDLVKVAHSKLSSKNKSDIVGCFNSENQQWATINLVGQAVAPESLFRTALDLSDTASADDILEALRQYTSDGKRLIIFIDELGKVFDGAAKGNNPEDIYFLQLLAEFVNRSQGQMILIGILHQAFTAYARQATAKMQSEWMKIQGRFVDFGITLTDDEQLYLQGQVINVNDPKLIEYREKREVQSQITAIINNISINRKVDVDSMTQLLNGVFPLHPLVAILLCRLSQKNFGQNQRSIFSFLMSAEPNGFDYFLKNTALDNSESILFRPHQFWDYLDSNLNSAISASEYGKQWLLSQMAVNRYQGLNDEATVRLIKVISLISIFADTTGIHATPELLASILDIKDEELAKTLKELESASIIFYRKFTQSYMLSQGSDFNLNDAILEQLQDLDELPLSKLEQFDPIVAKKHYQEKGSLRWMEIRLLPVSKDIEMVLSGLEESLDASLVGYFCLLIPRNKDELNLAKQISEKSANEGELDNLVIAVLDSHDTIIEMLRDKIALTNILEHEERLLNDNIARQETEGRLIEIEDSLSRLLDKSLDKSIWFNRYLPKSGSQLNKFKRSALVSKIADLHVSESFTCNNELVNRNNPSPSAKGAIRDLLKSMIEEGDEEELGIEKFPAHKGLYQSIILKNGLHRADEDGNYYFSRPSDAKLEAIWQCADDLIAESEGNLVTAQQIYDAWQQPPYGVKAGLHEILYIAYILSRHNDLASYINGEYKPTVQYLLAEYLIKVPDEVGVREVSFLEGTQQWIYVLQDSLQENFGDRLGKKIESEPLPIAQALIRVFDQMHPWIQRTNQLSSKTKQLRNILKQANDPNQLLFDDLPKFFNAKDDDEQKVAKIIEALYEMDYKYPKLVSDINNKLLDYLKVEQQELNPFAEINKRAEALFGRSGDYLLDAYIARLVKYDGSMNDAESLISLLAGNKPAKQWIDQDITRALQQIAAYSFQFLEAEVNADVNSSPDRQKVGLITKSPNATTSHVREAHITSKNLKTVTDKAQEILKSLEQSGLDLNDRVAVIAKLLEGFEDESKDKEGEL